MVPSKKKNGVADESSFGVSGGEESKHPGMIGLLKKLEVRRERNILMRGDLRIMLLHERNNFILDPLNRFALVVHFLMAL